MNHEKPRPQRAWRAFPVRDGRLVLRQMEEGGAPHCPWCRHVLEARPSTRLRGALVLDAAGYDLDCRGCRRFLTIVRHTQRSIRLVRMRRLVAAVRAVGGRAARPSEPVATA